MSPGARVVHRYREAPWLPAGGRADVLVHRHGDDHPHPIVVVRLLVLDGDRLLTVPRDDGDGVDLPSNRVDASGPEDCVEALLRHTIGKPVPASLLGYVRNDVAAPDATYPWPAPLAYFAVWVCRATSATRGSWLAPIEAERQLDHRHWWPLISYAAAASRRV